MQSVIPHRVPGKGFALVALMLAALLALFMAWSPAAFAQDATPGGEATPGGATPEVGPGAVATPALVPGEGMAMVSIVQASAALDPINIYIDGTIAFENVSFGTVTDFLEVSEDEHEIITVGAGGDTSTPAFSTTFDPDAGASYVLVIAGSTDDLQAKSWEMLLDPVEEQQSRVRVINAGHSLDPIDVALVGGDVLFEDVSYFEASDHANVPSGDIELEVRDAESDSPLATLPTFSSGPDTVVEVIVTVDEQGNPYEILVSAQGGAEDNGE